MSRKPAPIPRAGAPARWALVFSSTALLAFGACRNGRAPAAAPDAGPVLLGPESVAVAREEQLQIGPRISGSLEPREQAVLRAELGGSVVAVRAELGQAVKRGQSLARIEATTLEETALSARSGVRSAEQQLAVARRQLARTERLVGAGGLAVRELDDARAAATAAEAQLDDARARLATAQRQVGQASVGSPIDGVVSERAVNQGDVVAPGAPLFTIIDPSTMRLEASVPSEALAALRRGAPVTFAVRGYPDQTFEGTVERIAPAADPNTRQIPILVAIPNPGGRLIAGLFAEGSLAAESRRALVIPVSAVNAEQTPPTVLRLRDNVVETVAVELGLRDERRELVEVRSGLAPGDRVMVGAARTVPPGARVTLPPPTDAAVDDGAAPAADAAIAPATDAAADR